MSITVTTDNDEQLEIPLSFGRYTIVRKIGSGSSSVVFQVRKKLDPISYSCKVLSRATLSDASLASIEQELRVQSQLNHPNILSIKDVVYTKDLIFIIMDLCIHGDLMTIMTQDSVMCGLMFVRKVTKQIISALDYLHERGIAHRDIKPDNVMLDENFNAKLSDFGCCETKMNESLSGVGTLFYISPESLTGECKDGMTADIWSLGIVIFALAVRFFPWTSQTEDGVISEILKGEVHVPDTVPPDLAELINRCCKLKPEERATTKELLEYMNTCPNFSTPSPFITGRSSRTTMSSPSIVLKRPLTTEKPNAHPIPSKKKVGSAKRIPGSIAESASSASVRRFPPLMETA